MHHEDELMLSDLPHLELEHLSQYLTIIGIN
jgi:hypothetical protein